MESQKASEDPERILGPYKNVNLALFSKSPERRIQQNPFLITSNRQNSFQSIHWSKISCTYKVLYEELIPNLDWSLRKKYFANLSFLEMIKPR